MRTTHNEPGQLNEFIIDVDDECTGKGLHKRCQVYGDLEDGRMIGVTVTCDLDIPHLAHLPEPLPSQARDVAMGERRVHPRGTKLRYFGECRWENKNNGHRMVGYVFGF